MNRLKVLNCQRHIMTARWRFCRSKLPNIVLVADRKRALDSFVSQYTIVTAEDSLQKLARLNPAALDNKIDAIIEEKEKTAVSRRRESKKGHAGCPKRKSSEHTQFAKQWQ
jgi:hypothetical protein